MSTEKTVKFLLTSEQIAAANTQLQEIAVAKEKTQPVEGYIYTNGQTYTQWKFVSSETQEDITWFSNTYNKVYETSETSDANETTTLSTDATDYWMDKNLISSEEAAELINLLVQSSGTYTENDWVYSITGNDNGRYQLVEGATSNDITLDMRDRRLDNQNGTLVIEPDVIFKKTIDVKGTSTFDGEIVANNVSTFKNNVIINNDEGGTDPIFKVEGNGEFEGTLKVEKQATFTEGFESNGTSTINSKLIVNNETSDFSEIKGLIKLGTEDFLSYLQIYDPSYFYNDINIGADETKNTKNFNTYWKTYLNGDVTVNSVTQFNDNVTIGTGSNSKDLTVNGEIYNNRIPSQTHIDGNELADKYWTNSSIATATATFQGSYAPKDYGYKRMTTTSTGVTIYDELESVPFPYLSDGQIFGIRTEESYVCYQKDPNYPKTDDEIANWLKGIINNPPSEYETVNSQDDLPPASQSYFGKFYWIIEDGKYYQCIEEQESETYEWAVYNYADNNDYCFFQIWSKKESDHYVYFEHDILEANKYPIEATYKRFKFVQETGKWVFEYQLNNSGFTSNQWAAINSGITSSWISWAQEILNNCLDFEDFDSSLFYKKADTNVISIYEAGLDQSGIITSNEQSIYGTKIINGSTMLGADTVAFSKLESSSTSRPTDPSEAERGHVYIEDGKYYIARQYMDETSQITCKWFEFESPKQLLLKKSHAEGIGGFALYQGAHAEGMYTESTGSCSHAEGYRTIASDSYAHAEGNATKASGAVSHAEGDGTQATAGCTHAEGCLTKATGGNSHAEGCETLSSGSNSHSEGLVTAAKGYASHAEGSYSEASGNNGHAEGFNTRASSEYQHAQGIYNVEDSLGTYLDIVGNGNINKRSNAFALDKNGIGRYHGDLYVNCEDDSTGGSKVVAESVLDSDLFVIQNDGTISIKEASSEIPGIVTTGTQWFAGTKKFSTIWINALLHLVDGSRFTFTRNSDEEFFYETSTSTSFYLPCDRLGGGSGTEDFSITLFDNSTVSGKTGELAPLYYSLNKMNDLANWVTNTALSSYASKDWVTNTALTNYATQSWVTSNFVKDPYYNSMQLKGKLYGYSEDYQPLIVLNSKEYRIKQDEVVEDVYLIEFIVNYEQIPETNQEYTIFSMDQQTTYSVSSSGTEIITCSNLDAFLSPESSYMQGNYCIIYSGSQNKLYIRFGFDAIASNSIATIKVMTIHQ